MKELLLTLLEEAINECYEKDKCLIDLGMEQASVARIFYYMQNLIETDSRFKRLRCHDLDNEYNKKRDVRKDTMRRKNGTRPDIILHKRNSSRHNLLVVEFKSCTGKMKKDSNGKKYIDYIKLEDFTMRGKGYQYRLGVFVKLNKREAKYVYFQEGKEVEKTELK